MGTTAEKLSYLNGTKRLLRRRLNSLGANITLDTRFRDYLVWLDRFYEAASSSVKFEILGETTQEQHTSLNLLPNNVQSQTINGVTITRNEDGTLVLNGTATSYTTVMIKDNFELSAGTYYFNFYDTTVPTYFSCIYSTNGRSIDIALNRSLTFSEDMVGQVYINIPETVSFDNFVIHPMISEGSTQKPYEPYGTKPSPSNPSPIVNKTGNIIYEASDGTEFEIELNKNKVNALDVSFLSNFTKNNEIFTTSELNNSSYAYAYTIFTNKVPITKTGYCYVSADIRLVSGTVEDINSIRDTSLYGVNPEWVNKPTLSNEFQRYCYKFGVTANMGTEFNGFMLYLKNCSSAVLEVKNIMFSYLDDYSYEPYTTPIELCGNPNPNGKPDRIYYENRQFWLEKNVETSLLEGKSEEGWYYKSEYDIYHGANFDYSDYPESFNSVYAISNYFKNVPNPNIVDYSTADANLKNGEFAVVPQSSDLYLRYSGVDDGTSIDTAENFKNWISTHNVVLQYDIEEGAYDPILISKEEYPTLYNQLKAIIDHETKLEIEKKIF